MIESFACDQIESIWEGKKSRYFPPDIQETARRKLRYLNNAASLTDLRVPPGNRLEALSGNRKGQYSIRINDKWRICFLFKDDNAYDVEIIDYH